MDFDILKKHGEIAILFSPAYSLVAKSVYDECSELYPDKDIYLVSTEDILCAAKCDKYDSYILVGVECPLHRFENSVQYTIKLPQDIEEKIHAHHGKIFIDSIYASRDHHNPACADNVLVVSEVQDIVDYYAHAYEHVESAFGIEVKSRVRSLMKDSANNAKLLEKKMVGVVFTSKEFESVADSVCSKINMHSRAYKVFLKDTSYERLISIDGLDCIVLVDCPVFQFHTKLHIPVLNPLCIECYEEHAVTDCTDIVVDNRASEILNARMFKGVVFRNTEEDMEIHTGSRGIASGYEHEHSE